MKKLLLAFVILVMGCVHTGESQNKVRTVKKSASTYELIGDSVYRIGDDNGWGTGFAVRAASGKKYILTNDHVCSDLRDTERLHASDGKTYELKVKAKDDQHDLCIVSAPKNAKPLKVSETEPKYRDRVYTAGFPAIPDMTTANGITLTIDKEDMPDEKSIAECVGPKYEVKTGTIRGMFGPMEIPQCYMTAPRLQTSVKSDSGASGSPMINSRGEVIGVLMSVVGDIQFAQMVPLKYVRDFLSKY